MTEYHAVIDVTGFELSGFVDGMMSSRFQGPLVILGPLINNMFLDMFIEMSIDIFQGWILVTNKKQNFTIWYTHAFYVLLILVRRRKGLFCINPYK